MTALVHRAAAPDGLIQRCADCGVLLQDYRNTSAVGKWKPHWWQDGGAIEVIPQGMTLSTLRPNCASRVSPEDRLAAIFEEALSKMTPEEAEAAVERILASKPKRPA